MGLKKKLESFPRIVLRHLLCNCRVVLMQGLIYEFDCQSRKFCQRGSNSDDFFVVLVLVI